MPLKNKEVRTSERLTVGRCVMFLQGASMNCPLCKKLVHSGQHHECILTTEASKTAAAKKKARVQ